MAEDKAGLRKIYRKSWPYDNLFGTLRHDMNAAQRGVWNDLIDMAKIGRVRPGLVSPGPGKAYSHNWLAAFLNIELEELESTLKICTDTERICENGNGIEIINWKKYQTDYDRQKPWREARKKAAKDDPDKYIKGKYGHMVKRGPEKDA